MHRFRKRKLDMQKPDLDYNLRFKVICRTVVLRIICIHVRRGSPDAGSCYLRPS